MAKKTASQNKAQIQVVDRAARLLRILGDARQPLRLGVIVEQAGLSPSTTRRILSSLCDNGLVAQGSDGSYRLGLLLFELGSRVEAGFDLREVAHPALVRLSELTHLTAFLCVRHEHQAIAIERIDGRYAFSLALTVGGTLPLHSGGAPRVFLAYEDDANVRRYVAEAGPLERFTPNTIVDVEDLLEDLHAVKERGYVISNEDVTPGVAALAAPVFGHLDAYKPLAAISVAGLVPHVLGEQQEFLVSLLIETAELISRELGHGLEAPTAPPTGRPRRAA